MKLWFKFTKMFPRTGTFLAGLAILAAILLIISAFLLGVITLGMLIIGVFQIHVESTFMSFLLVGVVGTGFLVVVADILATAWKYGKIFVSTFYDNS